MELLVLDENFKSIRIIDSFKSVIWTDRYNSSGDFEIVLPTDLSTLEHLKEDYYIWIKDSEHCMIIENISISSDEEKGDLIVLSGRSLESILDRRIVWGQSIFNGNLQNAIFRLLNDAIINPNIPNRKIPNFIFEKSTNPEITKLKIDTQFTGANLYEAISQLCMENDIGFSITLNSKNQFVFRLYKGEDRSYGQNENPYVIFSPDFENLLNSNYFYSKAELKTVTLIAGEGEGASRKTTTVGSGSGLSRRELFTDARDISTNTEDGVLSDAEYIKVLQTRGYNKLSECVIKNAFEGGVEALRLFRYGEDFFIGDIVQIADEYGHEGRAYISEIIHSQNEEGILIYPTFQMIQEEGE